MRTTHVFIFGGRKFPDPVYFNVHHSTLPKPGGREKGERLCRRFGLPTNRVEVDKPARSSTGKIDRLANCLVGPSIKWTSHRSPVYQPSTAGGVVCNGLVCFNVDSKHPKVPAKLFLRERRIDPSLLDTGAERTASAPQG